MQRNNRFYASCNKETVIFKKLMWNWCELKTNKLTLEIKVYQNQTIRNQVAVYLIATGDIERMDSKLLISLKREDNIFRILEKDAGFKFLRLQREEVLCTQKFWWGKKIFHERLSTWNKNTAQKSMQFDWYRLNIY